MAGRLCKSPIPSFGLHKTNDSDSKILDSILVNLHCSKCQNYLQSPILMCESGHNTCEYCHAKSIDSPCTICKSQFNGQRNITIEKIIEELFNLCPNSAFGCMYRLPEKSMKEHLDNCVYHQYSCPFTAYKDCSWSGLWTQIKTHVKKNHPKNCTVSFGNEIKISNFDIKTESEDFNIIFYGKNVFVLHSKVDLARNAIFWVMKTISKESTLQKWSYNFLLYRNMTIKSMKATENCCSFEENFEKLVSQGHCIGIPLNILSNFISDKKELTFMINIIPQASSLLTNLPPRFRYKIENGIVRV